MAKKITGYIKLTIPSGKANPSPPIGPALGQKGVNIMEFCKAFNAATNTNPNLPLREFRGILDGKGFAIKGIRLRGRTR